jgi:hypothetical protein
VSHVSAPEPLTTALAALLPGKRTSKTPLDIRRTSVAPPAQLNVREKSDFELVKAPGMFPTPDDPPVTAAIPRTAPFAHRACGLKACVTARAEPPSAKKSARAARAVAGLGRERIEDLLVTSRPGS